MADLLSGTHGWGSTIWNGQAQTLAHILRDSKLAFAPARMRDEAWGGALEVVATLG